MTATPLESVRRHSLAVALGSGLLLAGLFSVSGPRAQAAQFTRPTPQFVVRAGVSDDVYVLMEDPSYPSSNRVERSTNGGATFQVVGSIPLATRPTASYLAIDDLIFPTPEDGYAFGPSAKGSLEEIYSTSDGGERWRTTHLPSGQQISSMVATPSDVYVTVSAPHHDASLERAPLSLSRWTVLAVPSPLAKYGSVMHVAAFGANVWLSTMDQVGEPYNSYVATSHDYGSSFNVSVQPLLNSVTACGLTAASAEVLWATCDQGMMAGQIGYSSDGGVHWTIVASNATLSSFFFGAIDPLDDATMMVVNERFPKNLLLVRDARSKGVIVGTIPNAGRRLVEDLCFVSERQGLMLTDGNGPAPYATLWRTDNGGRSWSKAFT
jgi:hypothetical protein